MRFTGWLFAFLLIGGSVPALAQQIEISGAHIVEYGLYESELKRTEPMTSLLAGRKSIVHPPRLLRKTITVPATIDTCFGYYFIVTGRPNGETIPLTFKIIHSTMQNPYTGESGESSEYTKEYEIGVRDFVGFRFSEKWELAPGRYALLVFYEGRPLLEKIFSVILPPSIEES